MCVDPVTDASGFPYPPSFDPGLGQCTGAVSCGRRHLPFRVGGRHARVPRVFVCVLLLVGLGGPASRARSGARHLFLWPSCPLLCSAPTGLGLPALWVFFFFCFFSLFLSPFFPPPLGTPTVSGFLCFPAPGALGLGTPCFCSPLPPHVLCFFFPVVFPLLHPPRGPLCCCFWCPGPWPPPFSRPPPFFVAFFPLCSPFFVPPLRASLVSAFPLFPALGALGLGALSPVSRSCFFLFFFPFPRCCFALPLFLVPGALVALGLWSASLGSFFLLRVQPCVWCVRRVPGLLSASFLAGAALLLRSRWPVRCVVACGCGVVAAGSGLPSVVFRWRALAWVVLPGRVARRPAVCFGSLWHSAPLCCVLCSVALCCRVAACCGALL